MCREKDLCSSVALSQGRLTEHVNECMRQALVPVEQVKVAKKHSVTRSSYMGYTPEERAKIGKWSRWSY